LPISSSLILRLSRSFPLTARHQRLWRGELRVDIPPSECCRDGKADQLQAAFEVMFLTRRSPRDAALFEWHDESLQTNLFFFSPEAAAMVETLIARFGGIEYSPPVLSERLVLLVGHPSVRETLLDTTQR
jgi:hypothetical protein